VIGLFGKLAGLAAVAVPGGMRACQETRESLLVMPSAPCRRALAAVDGFQKQWAHVFVPPVYPGLHCASLAVLPLGKTCGSARG